MSQAGGFDFGRDHFALFGLQPDFDLDLQALQARYRALQASHHPDKFAHSEPRVQREAMQIATRINEAYQILRNPRLRAQYLLALQGVAFDPERDTLQDPEFLLQQMEWREAQEAAEQAADPLASLEDLRSKLVQERSGILDAFKAHYAGKDWPAAKEDVLRMNFFDRLLEQIDERMSALEDAMFD